MNTRLAYGGLVALILASGVTYAWATLTKAPVSAADLTIDLVEGQALYAENCAVCHGTNLEGQGDWRSPGEDGLLPAPPHNETGHTWHHPDSLLFDYTKLGGKELLAAKGIDFNSGMPGFSEQLSDAEIWNIIGYIKSTWPERNRTVQSERTADDLNSQGE